MVLVGSSVDTGLPTPKKGCAVRSLVKVSLMVDPQKVGSSQSLSSVSGLCIKWCCVHRTSGKLYQ